MSAESALTGASETLLIPLSARAVAKARYPQLGFADPAAEIVARHMKVDLGRYAAASSSVRGCIVRGQWFDTVCLDFLARHPGGTILSLGSGLNTMYERVAAKAADTAFRWIDSDLDPVVDLRRRWLADDGRRATMTLDLLDPDLVAKSGVEAGAPLLVVAEGLLMYLPEAAVRRLFATLHPAGAEIAFDWPSPAMSRNSRRHPAVGRTQDKSVTFDWSLKRPSDLAGWSPPWQEIATHDIMSRSGATGIVIQRLHRLITGGRWFYGATHAKPA